MTTFARFSLIPIAILQFAAPALPNLGIGEPIGDRAVEGGIPPELPPGIFFAIWGVIFNAYLANGVLSNLKPSFATDRLAVPLALVGAGNVLWMISAQSIGSEWLNAVMLWPMLAIAWWGAYRLDRMGGFDGTPGRLLLCANVGLLAGWLTVAVGISLPPAMRETLGLGATDRVWLSLWTVLVPAVLLAGAFARYISRGLFYYIALLWGLSGVMLNTWSRIELHGLGIATAVIIAIIVWNRARTAASGSESRFG
ncbi:MAG: hypothetical protein AAGJ84_02315 [Pseudomonadota bacterium]